MTWKAAQAGSWLAKKPVRLWRWLLLGAAALSLSSVAHAEGPRLKGLADHEPGPRAGAIADAGPYHVELLIEGTDISIRIYDSEAKVSTGDYGDPLTVDRIGAQAILLISGSKETVTLKASNKSTLSGTTNAQPDASMKAVIRLQVPDQRPLQARFVPIVE